MHSGLWHLLFAADRLSIALACPAVGIGVVKNFHSLILVAQVLSMVSR